MDIFFNYLLNHDLLYTCIFFNFNKLFYLIDFVFKAFKKIIFLPSYGNL